MLAAEAADRAVHPASVTKVATSLALLQRLGPEHRFTTALARRRAASRDGVAARRSRRRGERRSVPGRRGRLPDPAPAARARRSGPSRAALAVHGPLLFDWERDPDGQAPHTRARRQDRRVADVAPGWPPLRDAALAFRGRRSATRHDAAPTPLVTYRSPPLLAILKALNGYSNNVFHLASDAIGGPAAVEAAARAAVAAGAARRDRHRERRRCRHREPHQPARRGRAARRAPPRARRGTAATLTAVLPVSGIDPGTLRERLLDAAGGARHRRRQDRHVRLGRRVGARRACCAPSATASSRSRS